MSRRLFQFSSTLLRQNPSSVRPIAELCPYALSRTVLDRVSYEATGTLGRIWIRGCTSEAKGPEEPPKKPSLFQRFKTMYRDYWYVLVPVHLVTSCGWFGGFYYLAESGVDLAAFAETLHFSDTVVAKLREGGHNTTGYLAISYLLYKLATPLRYTVTLGGTTVSINYLKKWGYIKPMPNREELKKIFEMQKETLKEAKNNMAQNIAQTKMKLSQRKSSPWIRRISPAEKLRGNVKEGSRREARHSTSRTGAKNGDDDETTKTRKNSQNYQ